MKINFRNIEAQTSFDGDKQIYDIAKELGNLMMYNGSILFDIGFEDLAKEIYYSENEVEVSDRYIPAIIQVMNESKFLACVKRSVVAQLTRKGNTII